MFNKIVVGLAASLVSFSALAVQKDITVTANVDTALEMTKADGTPLPSSVALQYYPAAAGGQPGLRPEIISTKIWSNDVTRDMQIKLVNTPQLVNLGGATLTPVDLKITHNNKVLTTTPTDLAAADVFPGGSNDSVAMNLEIGPKTPGAVQTGSYSGVVSIALVQTAVAP